MEMTGDPGDVMLFTEALTHAGAKKTSRRRRTTLQYNHVHLQRASPMWDHHNARHYWMPPSIRTRLMTIYIMLMFIGGGIGSWAGTAAYEYAGWTGSCLFVLILSLGVTVVSAYARRVPKAGE